MKIHKQLIIIITFGILKNTSQSLVARNQNSSLFIASILHENHFNFWFYLDTFQEMFSMMLKKTSRKLALLLIEKTMCVKRTVHITTSVVILVYTLLAWKIGQIYCIHHLLLPLDPTKEENLQGQLGLELMYILRKHIVKFWAPRNSLRPPIKANVKVTWNLLRTGMFWSCLDSTIVTFHLN